MKKLAKIIVFEGPDKVGKATQSNLAVDTLKRVGARVVCVEVPSKECTRTHGLIYWMLREGHAKSWPHMFQFVQFLNKVAFQLFVLPSLLRNNDIVVLDRWSLSAIVYGDATGVNRTFGRFLFWLLRAPDLTIVFTEKSYRRSSRDDDSYERDDGLQSRVRSGYVAWALLHPRHVLIRNDLPVMEVHASVMTRICQPCNVCGAGLYEHCDAGLHS